METYYNPEDLAKFGTSEYLEKIVTVGDVVEYVNAHKE